MKKLFFLSALALLTAPVFAQGISGKWSSSVNGTKMTLNITNDAITISADTSVISTESYTLSGDTLAIKESSGSLGCQGEGKYAVALKNNALSFTLINDECSTRGKALSGSPWVKAD